MQKLLPKVTIEEIIELRKNKKTFQEIAVIAGTSPQAVCKRLKVFTLSQRKERLEALKNDITL